ncbi:peptide deformylase, partial [Sinorhizobium meliloti]
MAVRPIIRFPSPLLTTSAERIGRF